MMIELEPALRYDIEIVWRMQVEAFSGLLEKYQDYERVSKQGVCSSCNGRGGTNIWKESLVSGYHPAGKGESVSV